MEIKRDRYLNHLISYMWDGQVKVITGIRRCGKSYLLRNLFRDYLRINRFLILLHSQKKCFQTRINSVVFCNVIRSDL